MIETLLERSCKAELGKIRHDYDRLQVVLRSPYPTEMNAEYFEKEIHKPHNTTFWELLTNRMTEEPSSAWDTRVRSMLKLISPTKEWTVLLHKGIGKLGQVEDLDSGSISKAAEPWKQWPADTTRNSSSQNPGRYQTVPASELGERTVHRTV